MREETTKQRLYVSEFSTKKGNRGEKHHSQEVYGWLSHDYHRLIICPSLPRTDLGHLVYICLCGIIINIIHFYSEKCPGLNDKFYGHLTY